MNFRFFIISILSFILYQASNCQAPLDPNNSIDWSKAGLDLTIPIPVTSVNVLQDPDVVGDGVHDDGPGLQNLISQSAYGTELYFPAASYLIKNTLLLKSGISLRGECPSDSKLFFDLSSSGDPNGDCIQLLTFQYGNYVDIVGSYPRKVNSIQVSNSAGFTVGSYAEIEMGNDPAVMYTQADWNQSWAQEAVGQMVKLTQIVGNTLQFSPSLNISLDANLNPTVRPTGLLEDIKLSDLYIERLVAGDGHTIEIKNAANCLLENIESRMTYRSHVNVTQALNIEVRNSFFHESHDYGGGGHGYGVELSRHTTNCLVESNIFETLRHSMMVHVGANGNVFGYNYSRNPTWPFGSTASDISIHGHYPSMNLFESNIVQYISIADFWGPSGPGNTYFRNRVETDNIDVMDFSHDQNIVGNELTAGSNQIIIESGINNTFVHANNVNGVISYDNSVGNQALPASLYLNISNASIGPEFVLNSGSIPAKDRYDMNEFIECGNNNQSSCKILPYSNIEASGGDPASQTSQEGPLNINDGNLNGDVSRWSRLSLPPNNLASIQFELDGGLQLIDHLDIAWWRGDIRTVNFDIYTSIDGLNFQPVQNSNNGNYTTSGTTEAFETFGFTEVMSSHVQIRGYSNSTNNWISISEVEVKGNCTIECPQVLTVHDQNISSSVYQASDMVLSNGKVSSPRVVRYISDEIHLLEDFEVLDGATFVATIGGCL